MYPYRISGKAFILLVLMWVALILFSADMVETGHWLLASFNMLVAMVMTFLAVD